MTPSAPKIAANERHRRETRRQIYWPFGVMVFVFILIMLLVFTVVLPRRVQVSLVADYLTILCFLCPLALCLFPIYLMTLAGLYGATRLHDTTESPLKRLEQLSQNMTQRATTMTDNLNQRTININVRFAFFNRLFDIFDRAPSSSDTTGENTHEPTESK